MLRKHDIAEATWPDTCGMYENGNRLTLAGRGVSVWVTTLLSEWQTYTEEIIITLHSFRCKFPPQCSLYSQAMEHSD